MNISRQVKQQIKEAIRERYAWPGGYPIVFLTSDGATLCAKCCRKEFRQIAWDWTRKTDTGWFVVAPSINWENDSEECCDHCGMELEAAY